MSHLRLVFGDTAAALASAAPDDRPVATREYRLRQLKGDRFPRGYSMLSVRELLAAEPGSGERVGGVASLLCTPYPGQTDPIIADHLYLTFSSAPTGVSEEDYIDWYRRHLAENLTVAGFESGWRFATTPDEVGACAGSMVTHLAMYALDGELSVLFERLQEATARGRVTYPAWFADRGRVSMEAVATGTLRPS